MGTKPKTRFAIEFDGIQREFLSVRERTNGDLLIGVRAEINYEADDGDNPIQERHISVHRSPDSSGTTIKHTWALENDIVRDAAAFVKDTGNQLLFWLYTKACPELGDRYTMTARMKDRVIPLRSFTSESKSMLIYHVFVSNSGFNFRTFNGFSLATAEFKHFQLGLYYTFPNFIAGPYSKEGVPVTSAVRVNGEFLNDPIGDGASSLREEEMEHLLVERSEVALANLIMRLCELTTPEEAAALMAHPLWFYPSPEGLALGRLLRGV